MKYLNYLFIITFLLSGCILKKEFKFAKAQYSYKELLEINIDSLPNIEDKEFMFFLSDKKIKGFPILLRVKNIYDSDIQIRYHKNSLRYIFESSIDLGGNCGVNMGRGNPDEFNKLLKLQPNEEKLDTVYYLNCYNYKGKFKVKYKDVILNEKSKILSFKNDSVVSNTIYVN